MYVTLEEMRLAIKHFTPGEKFSNKTLRARVDYFKQICAAAQLSDLEFVRHGDEIGIPFQVLKRIAAGEDVLVPVSECNNPVEHIAYTVGMLVPIQNDSSPPTERLKYRIQKINREMTVGWNCADYLEFKTSLNRYLNLLLRMTLDGELVVISKVDDPLYTAFETQQ